MNAETQTQISEYPTGFHTSLLSEIPIYDDLYNSKALETFKAGLLEPHRSFISYQTVTSLEDCILQLRNYDNHKQQVNFLNFIRQNPTNRNFVRNINTHNKPQFQKLTQPNHSFNNPNRFNSPNFNHNFYKTNQFNSNPNYKNTHNNFPTFPNATNTSSDGNRYPRNQYNFNHRKPEYKPTPMSISTRNTNRSRGTPNHFQATGPANFISEELYNVEDVSEINDNSLLPDDYEQSYPSHAHELEDVPSDYIKSGHEMIKAILVFNNHGKPRLSKFYHYFNEDMQQQIVKETFQLVSKRDDNVCNFLEGGSLIGGSDYKLIYRHYATLYFVFCVDSSESELGILDLIQVFVETLDKCFENVCELDLIFHVDKVHYILNELVMGGMVLETNMTEILTRIEDQNKLEKQEAGIAAAPARAVSAVKNMNIPQQIKDMKLPDLPQAIKDLKF
ncbi:hypothetical protein FQA39_LY16532 [Lamprigera yunnana]|nr:hypothetical protein FQA39_LY16532 [Lamprigera yunnana]